MCYLSKNGAMIRLQLKEPANTSNLPTTKAVIHTTLCIHAVITGRTTLCMNPVSGRDLDNERTISHAKSEAHRSTKSKRTGNQSGLKKI